MPIGARRSMTRGVKLPSSRDSCHRCSGSVLTVRCSCSKSFVSICCCPFPPLARRGRLAPAPPRPPPGARPEEGAARFPEGRRRRLPGRDPREASDDPFRLPSADPLPPEPASEEDELGGRRRRPRPAPVDSPVLSAGRRRRPPERRGRVLESGFDIRLLDHEVDTSRLAGKREQGGIEIP